MSKRNPALDEEHKEETISDEESGDETAPGDEPKEETISDEESRGETAPGDEDKDSPNNNSGRAVGAAIGAAIGGTIGTVAGAGVVLVGIPLCVGALGFTGAGIAAGSFAAKMMSAAAIANGGGVAAGSTVAVLQSIGAAGLSLGTQIGLTSALGSVGAGSGAWLFGKKKPPNDKSKKRIKTQVTNTRKSNLGDKHEEETTPDEEPKRSQAAA